MEEEGAADGLSEHRDGAGGDQRDAWAHERLLDGDVAVEDEVLGGVDSWYAVDVDFETCTQISLEAALGDGLIGYAIGAVTNGDTAASCIGEVGLSGRGDLDSCDRACKLSAGVHLDGCGRRDCDAIDAQYLHGAGCVDEEVILCLVDDLVVAIDVAQQHADGIRIHRLRCCVTVIFVDEAGTVTDEDRAALNLDTSACAAEPLDFDVDEVGDDQFGILDSHLAVERGVAAHPARSRYIEHEFRASHFDRLVEHQAGCVEGQ